MPASVIVGGQYGDEGKGKIISYIALRDSPVAAVRGGVGPNAGHTVVYNGKTLKLRMLPSAVINENIKVMIGSGVLVNPNVVLEEIEKVGSQSRVIIDRLCGIIEEGHIEKDKQGYLKHSIGTTGTGTGPAQADRVLRKAKIASDIKSLQNIIGDVSLEINNLLDKGKLVIVEGTQGTFLSLYHGTYPYVTSKDVTASAICADVGIGPKKVDDVIVVFKAYTTRVGEGPLQSELTHEEISEKGWQEFGTVTGRVRRAAPLNLDLVKRAAILNSATQIAITKIDTIFPECKGVQELSKLSDDSIKFIKILEEHTGVPVTLIGTGPGHDQIVDLRVK